MSCLTDYRTALGSVPFARRTGVVRQLSGLAIEARGPDVALGELCTIRPLDAQTPVLAEVVGVRPGMTMLMPYGTTDGLAAGCEVLAAGRQADIGTGKALLGRIIDGFGQPLDGGPLPRTTERMSLKAVPLNPLERPRITRILETGVRGIDTLLTLGQGQRVGIFAGSGVGKSTLLGMIARHAGHGAGADINVIALIGERGREVREFIDKHLGEAGLARSVVVVATSDQPALARLRAAYAAVAIAESFRAAGQQVLLTMDSVTRFAMARREVGLVAGEPPTARGYTPSVFAEIPTLCERCGTGPSGGAITALFTVLVDGDDMNEPVADCLRATLDGHIVLSRQLAHQGQFPAIDILQSTSRLMPDLVDAEALAQAAATIQQLALLERNRQVVEIGAYTAGAQPALDLALAGEPALRAFLSQSLNELGVARAEALAALGACLPARGRSAA